MTFLINNILDFGRTLIDKLFPDKNLAITTKAKLDELNASGELAAIAGQFNVLTAEASSVDKWTSRGRPAIIYTTLFFILFALPFGIFYLITPNLALQFVNGIKLWLTSIPNILYECMSTIVGLYTVCRTYEKAKGITR